MLCDRSKVIPAVACGLISDEMTCDPDPSELKHFKFKIHRRTPIHTCTRARTHARTRVHTRVYLEVLRLL